LQGGERQSAYAKKKKRAIETLEGEEGGELNQIEESHRPWAAGGKKRILNLKKKKRGGIFSDG